MAKAKKPVRIPPLSPEEALKLQKIVERASIDFTGVFDELESALGMLMLGRLVGWRVLVLIHSKSTLRKYEKILDINVREFFEPEGPLTHKSASYVFLQKLGSFWKGVSGDVKVENRRELTKG